MGTERCIIVGASHASAQLCASLRQEGWTGDILLIGDEASLPYQRPPLSKTYLAGKSSFEDLLIRKADFYDKQAVTFRRGLVTALDPEQHEIVLEDDERLGYDKLVLCLGARPRRIDMSGADLEGVHYLRDARDIEGIREGLDGVQRVVIVGAGYIGLETAASLRGLGVEVTVLEVADRVLQRVTAPEVSAFYDRVHREEGVDLRVGVGLTAIAGSARVESVTLTDGTELSADLVIVGVGVEPNIEVAARAGLEVGNGIVIDAHGRTSDRDVFAAGDCAEYPDERYGCRLRLESVPNAVEQAKVVAATICGKEKSISALPWFWSDQFDLKLQIAGLSTGYDDVVLRGDPQGGRDFACFYLREGRLIAADCVNRPQEFVFSKRAIAQGLAPEPDVLADPATTLTTLLQAPARV
jgi:3-phenylpropionate/trans-cinnamate dioxygenase ferredoxin reductase subunit